MSTLVITAVSAWEGDALDYGNLQQAILTASADGWQGDALGYGAHRAGGTMAMPEALLAHDGTYVRRCAQAATISPATLSVQVQERGGRAWRVALAWDRIGPQLAEVLVEFLEFVAGAGRTFSMPLDRFAPGVAPAPGDRLFRCVGADPGWSGRGGVLFGASLEALEVIGGEVAASDVVRATSPGWEGGGLDYGLPLQFHILPGSRRWEGENDAAA